MKTTTVLLTVLLLQLISVTTQLQLHLSLLPANSREHRPCATFIGTTAGGHHQLFSSNPADCPHVLESHAIELSYQPRNDGLLYSLVTYVHKEDSRKSLLSNFLAHVHQIINQTTPRKPVFESSSQLVFNQKHPSGIPPRNIRVLLDKPDRSSTVLVEVPLQHADLFSALLPAGLGSVSHPHKMTKVTQDPFDRMQASALVERLARLHYNPQIDQILSLMRADKLLKDMEILGGGGQDIRWMTRHSFSEGALLAAHWLKDRYQNLGARCQLDYYLPGAAPNLICKLSSLAVSNYPDHNNGEIQSIILTAHYDSKGSFGSILAPGVDDNASGCAVLLSIAEILQEDQSSKDLMKPKSTDRKSLFGRSPEIVFVHFSGTEQGLLGSSSVAEKFRDDEGSEDGRRRTILLLMNVDMISYRVQGEPAQIGLSTLGPSPESLAFIRRISNLYVPELLVGNSTIGLSDESQFHKNGFGNSVRIFERIGDSIRNPNHLKSSDAFSLFFGDDGHGNESQDRAAMGSYDILQTTLIAKVVVESPSPVVSPLSLSYHFSW